MNIITLDQTNQAEIAGQAAGILSKGGLVIAPFDTVYGIMADPHNEEAVKKLFEFKKRPLEKTIGLATYNLDALLQAFDIGENQLDFIKQRVPGNFTFILKGVPQGITSLCLRNYTAAVRIPDKEIILEIIQEFGLLIAQTSANKSGKPNVFSIAELKSQFSPEELEKVDLIIDGGTIASGGASLIYDLTGNQPIPIERV